MPKMFDASLVKEAEQLHGAILERAQVLDQRVERMQFLTGPDDGKVTDLAVLYVAVRRAYTRGWGLHMVVAILGGMWGAFLDATMKLAQEEQLREALEQLPLDGTQVN